MNLQLEGKTAFISGSTSGIGFAIAGLLAEEGAAVIINGRSQQKTDASVTKLRAKYPAADITGIAADFEKPDEIEALMSRLPTIDILINNLGIFEPVPFEQITDADWMRFYEVNVLSGVRLARRYLPLMLRQNWGRIIFISSESAISIPEEMIHYGMTKTAQLSVSRGLAELTRGTGVTVNAVLPGPTKSEGVEEFINSLAREQGITAAEMEASFFKTARPGSLIQRFADVNEIANLVAYVASPRSSATNGASLRVDGGLIKTIY